MIKKEELPKSVQPLLTCHTSILSEILENKLVGVYVHGSATTKGFSFEQSDIDYIAVIESPLSDEERQLLSQRFLAVFGKGTPGNGAEMHIVLRKYVGSGFIYPTPFEFHFGTEEQIRHFGNKPSQIETDYDLAGHLRMLSDTGICIFGLPIEEVFHKIPDEIFFDSITRDCQESHDSIMAQTPDEDCWVPSYATLNHCRTLSFIKTGKVCSKIEGGQWALEHLPSEHRDVVRAALEDKEKHDVQVQVSGAKLKLFSEYAFDKIEKHKTSIMMRSRHPMPE